MALFMAAVLNVIAAALAAWGTRSAMRFLLAVGPGVALGFGVTLVMIREWLFDYPNWFWVGCGVGCLISYLTTRMIAWSSQPAGDPLPRSHDHGK